MTAEQLRALVPPEGWTLTRRPTLRTSGSIVCEEIRRDENVDVARVRLQALYDWATQNDLGLTPSTDTYGAQVAVYDPNVGGVYTYKAFVIKANAPERTRIRARTFTTRCCGREVQPSELTCRYCYTQINCADCGVAGFTLHDTVLPGGNGPQQLCASCTKPCETPRCNKRLRSRGTTATKCNDCEPMAYCAYCDRTLPEAEVHHAIPEHRNANGRLVRRAQTMCNTCFDKRKCPRCDTWNQYMEVVQRNGEKMCRTCADAVDAEGLDKYKVFTPEELPISGDLLVPSTKQRPFRTISVETEMNGDGGFIARQLYRCGFVDRPAVAGYREYANRHDQHIAFLKHDGSVTGGELISYLLNLDDPEHADGFLQVLANVRALEKVGKASFGENAGGHIHIDAHNLDFSDAWRYITVYNYLENVIYRLGGAGTGSFRLHRTLVPGHDRANGGRGYSNVVIKGPFGTQSAFGKNLLNMDRMCGLNFQHFLNAKHNCECGAAAVENSKSCTCNLGKSTIEWRVWNATGNPRILHAWIALMQALTSFADDERRMTDKEEQRYPVFAWDRQQFDMTKHGTATKKRLEWIHTQLPLTQAERDSLIFTAKHSELKALGDEYLESLLQLENASAVPEKKEARNPNRRERKILIEAPAPDAAIPGGGAGPF